MAAVEAMVVGLLCMGVFCAKLTAVHGEHHALPHNFLWSPIGSEASSAVSSAVLLLIYRGQRSMNFQDIKRIKNIKLK